MLAACKTAQVTTPLEYDEDLSVHRKDFPQTIAKQIDLVEEEIIDNSQAVYYEGEITQELDSVNQIIIDRNKKQKLWDGYVIQVYRGDSRNEAYSIKGELDEHYPELAAEVSYFQPTYRVKAGRFFDRLEATRIFNQLKMAYPRALLLPEQLPFPNADK